MGFLFCNPLQRGGAKIYQPIGGLGANCNYSTYYNPTTGQEANIPFVPCGQAYTEDEVITILGENMTVLGE